VLAIRRDAEPLLGARLDDLVTLYQTAVLESHDGNEGIEAFLARRAPAWRNA
jgi:enoyl-CoA hydratase/carnithine racemase